MNTFTGKLTSITREVKTSFNGNPKFQLHFGNELVVTTSTDSMIAYMISDSLLGETLNLKYHYTPKKHKAILDDFTWNISC